jgi:hypothetical protein
LLMNVFFYGAWSWIRWKGGREDLNNLTHYKN